MHIDTAIFRYIQDALWKYLSICSNHYDIRSIFTYHIHILLIPELCRLIYRDIMRHGSYLYRGWLQSFSSSLWLIRLCITRNNLMSCLDYLLQGIYRKIRRRRRIVPFGRRSA